LQPPQLGIACPALYPPTQGLATRLSQPSSRRDQPVAANPLVNSSENSEVPRFSSC
jgi:hypothetical protein